MAKKKRPYVEPGSMDSSESGNPPRKKAVKKKAARKTPKLVKSDVASTRADDVAAAVAQLGTGYVPNPGELAAWKASVTAATKFAAAAGVAAATAPPPRVDWRNHTYNGRTGDWTTPVKMQFTCGACVAFAFCGVIESRVKLHCGSTSMSVDLSEADIWAKVSGSCANGSQPEEMAQICERDGVGVEADFRYMNRKDAPQRIPQYVRTYRHVPLRTVLEKKQCLADRGPFVATFQVSQDFMTHPGGFVFRRQRSYFNPRSYHAVMVGGYDDARGCWLIKNSWDTTWGDRGWCELGYGELDFDISPAYDVSLDTATFNKCQIPPPDCNQLGTELRFQLGLARLNPAWRNCLRFTVLGIGPDPRSLPADVARATGYKSRLAGCSPALNDWFRQNV